MKNLFCIIMLFSSLRLFSADHPWTRKEGSSKKSTTKMMSRSHPELSLTHAQLDDELDNDDERSEPLLVDTGTDSFVRKHERMIQRVKDVRNDIKGQKKALTAVFCKIKRLDQQVDLAIKPPFNNKPEVRAAKHNERMATLKNVKALLPFISKGSEAQSTVIEELLSIIDDLCPQQK